MITIMLSLNGFSQTVTRDSSIVRLQIDTARMVVKDLIEGDKLREERPILLEKVRLLEGKITTMTDLNYNLREQIKNYTLIISNKDKEIEAQRQIIIESDKEIKRQKRRTVIYKIGTILGAAGTLIFAVL